MNQAFEWSECSWYNTNCSFVTLTDGLPLKSHCRGVSVEVPTSLLLLRAVFINKVRFVLLKQMCMVLTLAVLKVYFFHAFLFDFVVLFSFCCFMFFKPAGSLCILCFFFLPSFPSRYIIFSIPFHFFNSVLDFLFLNVTFSFLLNFYFLMLSVIHFHCFFFFLFLTSSFLQRRGFGKAGIIRYETGVCNWIRPGSAQNKIPHCWMWLALHICMLLV